MTWPGNNQPSSRTIRAVLARAAQRVPSAQSMESAEMAFQNKDLDRALWHFSSPEATRIDVSQEVDDQLFKIPVTEEASEGEDPQLRAWFAVNYPGWNLPSFRSYPFEHDYVLCIPTWEQEYPIAILQVPSMTMMVIRSISYQVISGLAFRDLFEIKMYDPALRLTMEDAISDAAAVPPAHQYAFSGDTIPLPVEYHADRDHTVRFTVKARGVVTLAGVSNHFPGEDLIPNAYFRLSVQGWKIPLRDNIDGAPRPMDLGDMDFYDQAGA